MVVLTKIMASITAVLMAVVRQLGGILITLGLCVLFYEGVPILRDVRIPFVGPIGEVPYAGYWIEGRVYRVARDRVDRLNAANKTLRDQLRREATQKVTELDEAGLEAEKDARERAEARASELEAALAQERAREPETVVETVRVPQVRTVETVRKEYVPIPEPTPIENTRIVERIVRVEGAPRECPKPKIIRQKCPNPLDQRVPSGVVRSLNKNR